MQIILKHSSEFIEAHQNFKNGFSFFIEQVLRTSFLAILGERLIEDTFYPYSLVWERRLFFGETSLSGEAEVMVHASFERISLS